MATPTDLEALVRHLAGRQPGNPLDSPTDDPTSATTQILDEIRRRTRSLLDPPDDAATINPLAGWPGLTPAPTATSPSRGRWSDRPGVTPSPGPGLGRGGGLGRLVLVAPGCRTREPGTPPGP